MVVDPTLGVNICLYSMFTPEEPMLTSVAHTGSHVMCMTLSRRTRPQLTDDFTWKALAKVDVPSLKEPSQSDRSDGNYDSRRQYSLSAKPRQAANMACY